MKGEYSIIIVGPEGVAMMGVIDLEKRDRPRSLSLDDKRLQELLVVNAILGAVIEGELVKGRQADPMTTSGIWRMVQGANGPVPVLEESLQQAIDRIAAREEGGGR